MSVQAWPKDALEIQSKRSSPSESQTPSYWEERKMSAAADDKPDQPHVELQVRVLMLQCACWSNNVTLAHSRAYMHHQALAGQ